MTEDETKINDLMLSVSWNGITATQETIQKIDDKANNTLTFSGILIALISGFLVGLIDKIPPIIIVFLIVDLLLLSVGIYYAFNTIWLKEQEFLDVLTTFKSLDLTNSSQATLDFSISLAAWQKRAKKIGEWKSAQLLKSMTFVMGALIFIIIIALILAGWQLGPMLCELLKN